MSDLSVLIDESGSQEGRPEYYVVTFVLHDQSNDILDNFARYSESLSRKGLPDIPYHANSLMRGNDAYANMPIEDRKSLLVSFGMTVQKLPVRYRSFMYMSKEFGGSEKLQALIERNLAAPLADNLEYFQSFDHVKVYYDNGQHAVTKAPQAAFSYVLSKEATIHRDSDYRGFRLAQVADYFCTIELAAVKYEQGKPTETDNKFFGGRGPFKKNWLKQARRKRMA